MAPRPWRSNRFDSADSVLDPLTNLVDIMLVFAVGLMAALVAVQGNPISPIDPTPKAAPVTRGREVPRLPDGVTGQAGEP